MRKQHSRLSWKIVRNYLLSTLVPFVLVTFGLANVYQSNYHRDMKILLESAAHKLQEGIESYIGELEQISMAPYYNEDFTYLLKKLAQQKNTLVVSELENSLGNIMSFLRYTRSDISGALIVTEDQGLYATGNLHLGENVRYADEAWYQAAIAAKGSAVLIEPHYPDYYKDKHEPVFSIVRTIVQITTRKPICVVKVDANILILTKMLANTRFHVASALAVTDKAGRVVTGTGGFAESGTNATTDERFSTQGDVFVKELTIDMENGWKLYMYLSQNELNARISSIYTAAAVLYLVCSLVALMLYFTFSLQLIRGMNKLEGALYRLEAGQLDARCTLEEKNWLHPLSISINHMAARQQEKIQSEYLLTIRQKEAELRALQAQINPHFLFNTLSGLVSLNQLERQREVDESLCALITLLRYATDNQKTVPLFKELEFIENYCSLQKMRYGERFSYAVSCGEGIASFRVFKMILQPIVENALIHGIEPSVKPCTIDVSVARLGHRGIEVKVVDDGVGFDCENHQEHIGLTNIRNRLSYFKGHNRLTIQSAIGTGTTVTIVMEEEADDEHPHSGR